jgi:hypothetical protein
MRSKMYATEDIHATYTLCNDNRQGADWAYDYMTFVRFFYVTRGFDLTETPLIEWAAKFWDKGKILGQPDTPPCRNFIRITRQIQ